MIKTFFQRLKPRHYAWASVLAIVGIWWPSFILATPPEFIIEGSVNLLVLNICMIITMIGAVTKIIGYFGSQQQGKIGVIGISVELVGLVLAAVGPFAYIAVSLAVGLDEENSKQIVNSAVIFAVGIFVMYVYRAMVIVPRFLREAHDEFKEE